MCRDLQKLKVGLIIGFLVSNVGGGVAKSVEKDFHTQNRVKS